LLKTTGIFSTIRLNEFIHITLCDETLHYFGGYYHVKVLAYCDLPLVEDYFDSKAEFEEAVKRMGESARFERILEKMAVPEDEKISVRSQLVDAFYETALAYISVPGFAERFVRTAYLKCINKPLNQRFSGV